MKGAGEADRHVIICEVQGGWVLVSLALAPVSDNSSVGLSLPICKLGLTSVDAGLGRGAVLNKCWA